MTDLPFVTINDTTRRDSEPSAGMAFTLDEIPGIASLASARSHLHV